MKIYSFFKTGLTPELYRSGKNNSCLCWGLNQELLGIVPGGSWDCTRRFLEHWYTVDMVYRSINKIAQDSGKPWTIFSIWFSLLCSNIVWILKKKSFPQLFLCIRLQLFFPSVHFNGGIWGVIAVAFLSYPNGILIAWDKRSGLVSKCSTRI